MDEALIQQINDAFERGDAAYFVDRCTDDVRWTVVDEETVAVMDAPARAMAHTRDGTPPRITVTDLVVDGDRVACLGSMTMDDGAGEQTYAFRDVYGANDEERPRIRALTSFVISTQPRTGKPGEPRAGK